MISIPLPFVITLLLSILAAVLYVRQETKEKPAFLFLTLCALSTAIVGMRWTLDLAILRFLQPLFASLIPATAWYCFSQAHGKKHLHFMHFIAPLMVMIAALTYPFWHPPIDPVLTLLYIGYGFALIKASLNSKAVPENVSFSEIEKAQKAERIAGFMLLFSAAIDGTLAIDFAFFQGEHAVYILMIGHTLLLPVLSLAVIIVSLSIRSHDYDEERLSTIQINQKKDSIAPQSVTVEGKKHTDKPLKEKSNSTTLDEAEVDAIIKKLNGLMTEKEVFLDPDLTLDRLARKLIIPARHISNAVNQVYGRNISQVINEYRIERAKQLLENTHDPITQVYLNSGFQTKSNFHREFTRITQKTPSAYRRSHNQLLEE
ncbi:helix-turn-helix domain-containing protein [Marinomonas sp. 2405UD68-3]|uniref:helix-turn-helix domain-containing protein n=1 Tax=Marinomonas sp. 2405UD68-3 TaxID=3391835 RepID=UPI0039C8D9EC